MWTLGGQQTVVEGQRRSAIEEGVSYGPSLPWLLHPRGPPIYRWLPPLLPPLPPVVASVPASGVPSEGHPH